MTSAWKNEHIYAGLDCPNFTADFDAVHSRCEKVAALSAGLSQCDDCEVISLLHTIQKCLDDCHTTLAELRTFVFCHLAIDGSDELGQMWQGKLHHTQGLLERGALPFKRYIATCAESTISEFLAQTEFATHAFVIERSRMKASSSLSEEAECLLERLEPTGLHTWGERYRHIASSLKVEMEEEEGDRKTIGACEARQMLACGSEFVRKSVFSSLNEAWEKEKNQCAAILNSIAAWRLAEDEARKEHFLDDSLFQSRLSRSTLDALLDTVRQGKEIGQRIFSLQAKVLGKEYLAPWDWYAPAPSKEEAKLSYEEAIRRVQSTFSAISPSMGEFTKLMNDNDWIDSRILITKSAMPFCTYFPRAREPRVSVPFTGTAKNLQTLAHELGHAYHYWVMRDLPLAERPFPMSIAETAGIFAQNAMSEVLLAETTSEAEELSILWEMCAQVRTFLFHDLAIFDFEFELYEKRTEGPLMEDEISEIFGRHWQSWFGPHYGHDEDRWLRTIFPFMTDKRFYNYPYALGFLFALVLQGQRVEKRTFPEIYDSLLADSGRMTLEDLAKKHMGFDLQEPQFWSKALVVAGTIVDRFEEAVANYSGFSDVSDY